MASKRALAISGGGMKGAFAVGAVLALREQGITDFDIVAGTSTGALIAPLVLIHEYDLIHDAYASTSTADIYDKLSELTLIGRVLDGFLKGKPDLPDHFGTMEPLREQVSKHVTPERYDRMVRASVEDGRELFLTTVDLHTGELVYWTLRGLRNADPSYRIIASREQLIDVMVASASIPMAAPPVQLPDQDSTPHQHVDGGVRETFPMWICIERGATDLYAIGLQADPASLRTRIRVDDEGAEPKPLGSKLYEGGIAVIKRTVDLLTEEGREDEVRFARMAAGAGAYLAALREAAADRLGEDEAWALFDSVDVENPFAPYRLERLHVIRPEGSLPIGTLDATPEKMQALIAYGRARTGHALIDPVFGDGIA